MHSIYFDTFEMTKGWQNIKVLSTQYSCSFCAAMLIPLGYYHIYL